MTKSLVITTKRGTKGKPVAGQKTWNQRTTARFENRTRKKGYEKRDMYRKATGM